VDIAKELDVLKSNSIKNNVKIVNVTVHKLLALPDFWIHCYESIKSNPGTSSLGGGVEGQKPKTLDGLDEDFFSVLSRSIITGKFQFGATRQTFIPKGDGGSRPLGIADSRDKIVQKGMAILLEVTAEHRFYENSFGFRRNKSAHDAISFIKTKVPSGTWAIEGDISSCFDSFDHKRLVSTVKKKYISNQVFIDLLYKALKVRIISIHSNFLNKVGTPQGSVVSPILCNIYLHELDTFVMQGEELSKYRSGKNATSNWAFTKQIRFTEEDIARSLGVKKEKGKRKYWKFMQKLRVKKIKEASASGVPRLKYKGVNRKITYVRFADDFVIFVWGTKSDCIEIKYSISKFLKGDLALNLSSAKTRITYLKKDKVKFLGFEIWQPAGSLLGTKKDLNPDGSLGIARVGTKFRGAVKTVPRIRITFSMTRILRSLVDKGLARFKNGEFFPTSYKPVLCYELGNIVNYLKSVFRGLSNYYVFCDNWYDTKSLYDYFGRYCVAMTLAHKTKSKVPKIFKKYGWELTLKSENDKVIASYGKFKSVTFRKQRFTRQSSIQGKDVDILLKSNLKIAKMHMIRWRCVICQSPAEMHHLKHVRKVLNKKVPNSFNAYLEAMRIVNRKTLPVCKEHHNMIHRGEYDGTSLKNLFKSFKDNGIGFSQSKANQLLVKVDKIK
jgi:group II intron reverse transcriptase/maturase